MGFHYSHDLSNLRLCCSDRHLVNLTVAMEMTPVLCALAVTIVFGAEPSGTLLSRSCFRLHRPSRGSVATG